MLVGHRDGDRAGVGADGLVLGNRNLPIHRESIGRQQPGPGPVVDHTPPGRIRTLVAEWTLMRFLSIDFQPGSRLANEKVHDGLQGLTLCCAALARGIKRT